MTDTAMTPHAVEPEALKTTLEGLLGEKAQSIQVVREEVTLTVKAADYLAVMQTLRDAPQLVMLSVATAGSSGPFGSLKEAFAPAAAIVEAAASP